MHVEEGQHFIRIAVVCDFLGGHSQKDSGKLFSWTTLMYLLLAGIANKTNPDCTSNPGYTLSSPIIELLLEAKRALDISDSSSIQIPSNCSF